MKRLLTLLLLLLAVLSGCCTKKDCPTITDPGIILFFPEASAANQYVLLIRLQGSNNQVVDSTATSSFNHVADFAPWYQFHNGDEEWSSYNYVIRLDEPGFVDTIYNISYDKHTVREDCNSCFPPSDKGKTERTRYDNLKFFHKGRQLQEGDTVRLQKR